MHGPSTKWGKDKSSSLKQVLGLWLVILYSLVYAGFIIINVISPDFMAIDVGSFNVAITYGFLLILFALLLASIYNHVCSHAEEVINEGRDGSLEERENQ